MPTATTATTATTALHELLGGEAVGTHEITGAVTGAESLVDGFAAAEGEPCQIRHRRVVTQPCAIMCDPYHAAEGFSHEIRLQGPMQDLAICFPFKRFKWLPWHIQIGTS